MSSFWSRTRSASLRCRSSQNLRRMANRPRSKRKRKLKQKSSFVETKLGYLISRTAPLEYSIILEVSGDCAPSADMIEALSYVSLDPIFRTADFRLALMEYRKTGLRPPRVVKPVVSKELKYIKYRRARSRYEKARTKS